MKHVVIERDEGPSGTLVLRVRRFDLVLRVLMGLLGLLPLTAVGFGIVSLVMSLLMHVDPKRASPIMGGVFIVLFAPFLLLFLTYVFNSYTIELSRRGLTWKHGPFAWIGLRSAALDDVVSIGTAMRGSRGDHEGGSLSDPFYTAFLVHVRTATGTTEHVIAKISSSRGAASKRTDESPKMLEQLLVERLRQLHAPPIPAAAAQAVDRPR